LADTNRSFIAIDIQDHIKRDISKVQAGLKSYGFDIKWVRPEAMHLTLIFLGEIPASSTGVIREQMTHAAKGVRPFSIFVKGVGAFPDARRPRVVITDIDGEKNELKGLKNSLDGHLEILGFPIESRPFKGHLTLGRVIKKIDGRQFEHAIKGYSEFSTHPFEVSRMILFKSDLKPSGPIYSEMASIDFFRH